MTNCPRDEEQDVRRAGADQGTWLQAVAIGPSDALG